MGSKDFILLIVGVLGGLSLFLYGMILLSDNIKKIAGSKFRNILESITRNKFIAFVTGITSSLIMQSSNAVSALILSLVQSKLLTFNRSIVLLLGVGIGTTITAQLVAFKVTDYALAFVILGFVLSFFCNSIKLKNIGATVLGFGILFFGMYIMGNSMSPLKTYQPFINLLVHLENPFIGILVGFIITALLQSSAPFVGLLVILASQGLLTLNASMPMVLGANIGATITALIISISANRETKRVAYTFLLVKTVGVILLLILMPFYIDLVKWISPNIPTKNTTDISYISQVLPRQIANAHTLFNLFIAIIFLPFTGSLAKFILKIYPNKAEKKVSRFKTQFLENSLIDTPTLAATLAKSETNRMSTLVELMIEKIMDVFLTKNLNGIEQLKNTEDEVDFLRQAITKYITAASQQNVNEELTNELFQIMYVINELEEIGDIVSGTLIYKAEEWAQDDRSFSEEGRTELIEYHTDTLKHFRMAMDAFSHLNLKEANKVKRQYKEYMQLSIELKRSHFNRLSEDLSISKSSSKTHMQLIGALRIINSHSTNIARIVLEGGETLENKRLA